MTYKLKRQIVDKIHKSNDPALLRIIANLLNIKKSNKTGSTENANEKLQAAN